MINNKDYKHYWMLKEALRKGAKLAPVDFEFMDKIEKIYITIAAPDGEQSLCGRCKHPIADHVIEGTCSGVARK